MNLLIIRHGETLSPHDSNGNILIYGHRSRLSLVGRDEQITGLAQTFNDMSLNIDSLFFSPFYRAAQSAAYLVMDLKPDLRPKLFESLDDLRGATLQWDLRPESELALVNDDIFAPNPVTGIRGETLLEARDRAINAFMMALKRRPTDETIALVTHGEIANLLRMWLLDVPKDDFLDKANADLIELNNRLSAVRHEIIKPTLRSRIEKG